MSEFDSEDVRLRLEAMKLHQGTLLQVMTLSAGGLALYFGFIEGAQFVQSGRVMGIIVVAAWIVALCAASVAHQVLGNLFVHLYHLSNAVQRWHVIEGLPTRTQEEVERSVDPSAVVARALGALDEAHTTFRLAIGEFERAYFPAQEHALILIRVALYAMVIGFATLGVGYAVWVYGK